MELFYSLPDYIHLAAGFLAATAAGIVRAVVTKRPPENWQKICDALWCGMAGSCSCVAALHYGVLDPIMIVPVCFIYGCLSMLRINDWLADFIRFFVFTRWNVDLRSHDSHSGHTPNSDRSFHASHEDKHNETKQ